MPNETSTFGGEFSEGLHYVSDSISLSLDEDKIREVVGKRIERGEAYWNTKLNLKEIREKNEKRWLNNNLEVSGNDQWLYDFQAEYRDNRIFVSVETLKSNLVAKIPRPETTEAQDTDASRELAVNYGKVLYRKAEDLGLKQTIQMVAGHLLIGYRLGVVKLAWDYEGGRILPDGSHTGDVTANFLMPDKIVLDAEADNPKDVPLIAEKVTHTIEELGFKFEDKKDEILNKVYATRGRTGVGMGTKLDYYEVWFSFYDDDGVKREGVLWKYLDLLLDYGINPYFNYDAEDVQKSNYFEQPQKPYILFNFLRTGRYALDDTSLTEQAANQQDILEKRGAQIVGNADQANATKVFNTLMIDAADAEKYVSDPNQNIMAKGDVRAAFTRVPPPVLPRYVIEDKYDARREIDNIFGTHAPLRGEKTESPTLGQEVMSQRSDLGRQTTLGESIEKGTEEVFKYITQLYKVFAIEEHIVKYLGPESGNTTFIKFSQDKIEDGMEIRIRAGSMKADDKMSDRTEAIELAKIGGRIDPLTFMEKWHVDRPVELAKRLFYSTFMPDRYAMEVLKIGQGGADEQAMQDIQMINMGQEVKPVKDVSPNYAAYYEQYVNSPSFKQLPLQAQKAHMDRVKGLIGTAKGGLKEPVGPNGQAKPGIMDRFAGLFGGGV